MHGRVTVRPGARDQGAASAGGPPADPRRAEEALARPPAVRPLASRRQGTQSPVLAALRCQHRMWADWWRLRRLWSLLSRAAPEVRLPRQPGTGLNARYRLHRRIIEIRDAEFALRPYWDKHVAGHAAAAAASAGLPPGTVEAITEAAVIMAALAGLQQGRQAADNYRAAEPVASAPHNDLDSEAARLLLVADAIRHSPIVRDLAAGPRGSGSPARHPAP